jgi:disulfide bond formation protein DsbB
MLVLTSRNSALLVAVGAAAALAAALYFQHVLGYQPCQMCLWQRWAYYAGIPLALAAFASGRRELLILVALIFAANALLGAYHAGVEWKLWEGPASCGAGAGFTAGGNKLEDLRNTRIVPCDAASWRFLGLSFAGWNVVASLVIALIALRGAFGRAEN